MTVAPNNFDERQEAEDSGRNSRIVSDMLARAAGIWTWTLQSDCQRISVRGDSTRILEAPPTHLNEIVSHLHPDDQATLGKTFTRAAQKGGRGELDCRLLSPDKRWLHFHVVFETEPSPEGGFLLHGLSQDVTRLLESQDRALQNAERLRIALDVAKAGVCEIDFKARSVWCPDFLTQLLGQKLEFPRPGEPLWPMCHLDDRHKLLDAIWNGDRHDPIELRIIHPDGVARWVELHGERELDREGSLSKITALVLDIDARKRQELALIEAREEAQALAKRLKVAMDAASAGVFETDFETGSFWCSPEFTQIVGRQLTFEEASGVWPIVHPDDAELVGAAIAASQATTSEAAHAQWRVCLPSGESRWVEVYGLPTYGVSGNVPQKLTGVILDIDARKRQESALVEARQLAEAAAEAKSRFLANMSHELRTPLTSIIGFSRFLHERQDLPADALVHARRIFDASEALLAVINDVLDISKLDAGHADLDLQPLSIGLLVEGVKGLLNFQAEAKGIVLKVELDPKLPALVLGDIKHLRQVLLNLVGNAVKFTSRGAVTIGVSYDAARERLRVEIVDTGPGIAPETLPRLFERFSQGEVSTSRTYGGTGLGLAISRKIVTLLGGEIGVESHEGQGSAFWFEIPAPPEGSASEDVSDDACGLECSPLRLLVVDDLEMNRELIKLMLEPLGFVIEQANDGAQAIQAALKAPFDLILMDVRMPGVDGLEASRLIRGTVGPNCRTPILAFTADVGQGNSGAFHSAGMNDVIAKPISTPELISKIIQWTTGEAFAEVAS